LGAKRSEGIPKQCEAVSETSGWSRVARTKPSGLSFCYEIKAICRNILLLTIPTLFSVDHFLLFFFLDKKETKNQDCIKKAKNYLFMLK
jgi:hypothetical protein